ncbi:hypothetical protein Hypma_016140 [Hypsizygus marmoreus]|uniref:Uncharacterized protein n=1 Tax=Hypsizygus marmoreus TaxID=39966 RepID=A0A369IZ45_HYPMA|nr:hypothetical protein Hypma_016140 [Hypsizygus marmoreus]
MVPGVSKELRDDHDMGSDYYLSREWVDKWVKGVLEEMLPTGKDMDDGVEPNPCADRSKNMVNELTTRMWGIFDETGTFLALCRHGFVLVVTDIVQSGELAKYPLAVVEVLLDAFSVCLGGGYDIGCKFGTTFDRSPLGPLARELEYKLSYIAKYVKEMGLEDLEECERFFSKSNALAPSMRYASVFHRKQWIHEFIKHMDKMDTYQNLSEFLINNYKQAIDLLNSQAVLDKQMADQNVGSMKVFEQWLAEEKAYLLGLSKEPLEETLQMKYYQKLVNLNVSQKALDAVVAVWVEIIPETYGARDFTASKKTDGRHALENLEKDLAIVQGLEARLGITARWTSLSVEWDQAAAMVSKRHYQWCLDTLEGLVISRMFELTKMNMFQTATEAHWECSQGPSQAVRTALEKYNIAAKALSPSCPELSWDMVVEYAFLADFDLLSDTREDVCECPWATPAARILMDQHFKILRAHEEIKRLNIEIPRLVTYIRDEEAFLKEREGTIGETDSSLVPGTSVESSAVVHYGMDVDGQVVGNSTVEDGPSEVDGLDNGAGDDKNDDDDEDVMLAELAHAVLQIASDI